MKLLHIYPAVAAITDCPRLTPGTVVIQGRTFYVWRNHNVYLDSETRQVRYKETPGESCYWTQVRPDLLVCVSKAKDDAHFRQILTTPQSFGKHAGACPIDKMDDVLKESAAIADDPEGYSQRKTAEIQAKRTERLAGQLSQATAKREAEEKATAARIAANTATFRKGEYISLADFEELCKLHGVVIPIRTIGSARRSVTLVSTLTMRLYSGAGTPWALLECAKKLKAALVSKEVAA